MKKDESTKITQFACFVRNVTARPIRLSVPLGMMERQPPINPQVLKTLIRVNRERYCAGVTEDSPPSETWPPDDSPLGEEGPI